VLTSPPTWRHMSGLTDYAEAMAAMEHHVAGMQAGHAGEEIWLVEHPPIYTLGVSAKASDVRSVGIPSVLSNRGGQVTYHGPGQRVVYAMLDLNTRGRDLRAYVAHLEDWVISTLGVFGVRGERRAGRVGVWVVKPDGSEAKIAALGVKVRRWYTFHGISINVNPDMDHFKGIVPCGITDYGVTSLADLGIGAAMTDLDEALQATFADAFTTKDPWQGI